MKFITSTGRSVLISDHNPLGSGGEGRVFPILGDSNLVAKIFHRPTPSHHQKLIVLIANPLRQPRGRPCATWPKDLLFTAEARPTFAGYIMRRLDGARQIFFRYNTQSRLATCPGFDYRYLLRTGCNLAAVVSLAHSRGHVIGDVNESNAFVADDAYVILSDVDSWQVTDPLLRQIHLCPVAKPDFLPPELQNLDLSNFDRSPCHDNFALAVLLFKLICEGNHPYDGIFRGTGEPPSVEARIAGGVLPFRDRSGCWLPKPAELRFSSLHPLLQQLFLRAFETGYAQPNQRPDGGAWQVALAKAERDLRVCPRNSRHWHWFNRCPWCDRAALLGGFDSFPEGKRSMSLPNRRIPIVATRIRRDLHRCLHQFSASCSSAVAQCNKAAISAVIIAMLKLVGNAAQRAFKPLFRLATRILKH